MDRGREEERRKRGRQRGRKGGGEKEGEEKPPWMLSEQYCGSRDTYWRRFIEHLTLGIAMTDKNATVRSTAKML